MTTTDNNQILLLPAGNSGNAEKVLDQPEPFKKGEKGPDGRDINTGRLIPGHSLRSPGRPKGSTKKLKLIVDEELAELGAKDAQGNPVSIERALVKKIIKMALAGDRKMIELIWNYRDGKPSQAIDVTSNGQHINKRKLSDEEIQRVDDIFAPKDWAEDELEENDISYGPIDNQPKTEEGTGESDAPKPETDSGDGPRQSQEGNA
jgi:hypothetical protein